MVLGHGVVRRRDRSGVETEGRCDVREIMPESIDERVQLSAGEAFQIALRAVDKDIPALLKTRMGSRMPVREQSLEYLRGKIISSLRRGGAAAGRLAILPKGNGLVWNFDASTVRVAVSATTRETTIYLKMIVD